MISVICPQCQTTVVCDDLMIGQKIKCSTCQGEFTAQLPPLPPGRSKASETLNAAKKQTETAAAKVLNPLASSTEKVLDSKFGRYLSLWISAAALLLAIAALLLSLLSGGFHRADIGGKDVLCSAAPFEFSKDAETTARNLMKLRILQMQKECNEQSYFFYKFGEKIYSDMEFEVMEEGKFAAVFSKSSFRGKNICNHFSLIKNADGCYVEAQPHDFNKAPVKWLKKVNDKIRRSNAQDDSEKIDISDVTD